MKFSADAWNKAEDGDKMRRKIIELAAKNGILFHFCSKRTVQKCAQVLMKCGKVPEHFQEASVQLLGLHCLFGLTRAMQIFVIFYTDLMSQTSGTSAWPLEFGVLLRLEE